jgi:hypothetical protein
MKSIRGSAAWEKTEKEISEEEGSVKHLRTFTRSVE